LRDSDRFFACPPQAGFAQNDNLKPCVILRGGWCPEESLRGFEEEEIFLTDTVAACGKCGLGTRVE